MRNTVHVVPATTVGDFAWCLKSTTEERGEALLKIALEWSGDGEHPLDEREAVAHATEQVINLMAFLTSHFDDRAALKIVGDALARSEEWDSLAE